MSMGSFMSRSTTLSQLSERHDHLAAAQSKRLIQQTRHAFNQRDIPWLFWDQYVARNLGRSARVFYRLVQIDVTNI